MEIARDAVQAFSQEELLEAFEKEGISVLPLKGILMKRFYPVTSMRMMADLDILYETGRGKEVEAVLTDPDIIAITGIVIMMCFLESRL